MSITRLKERLDVNVDQAAIQASLNSLSARVLALETDTAHLKRQQVIRFKFHTLNGYLYDTPTTYWSDDGVIHNVYEGPSMGAGYIYRVEYDPTRWPGYQLGDKYLAFVQMRSMRQDQASLTNDNDMAPPIVRFSTSYNWFDIIVEHSASSNKNIMFQGFMLLDPTS